MKNTVIRTNLNIGDIAAWLYALRAQPYIPESHFPVSAIIKSGDYYFAGVNVENSDHRLSTHAEEGAIAAMVATLGKTAAIDAVYVMGATCCGKCRQQLSGFASADTPVYYLDLDGTVTETTSIGAFLPGTFNLGLATAARAQATTKPPQDIIREGALDTAAIFDWIRHVDAVDFFSKSPQAAILQLNNGAFVAGAKIEDEAFLSITAVQAAQAISICAFGPDTRVTAAWLYSTAPWPLSAFQALSQLAAQADIPIHIFTADGRVTTSSLPCL